MPKRGRKSLLSEVLIKNHVILQKLNKTETKDMSVHRKYRLISLRVKPLIAVLDLLWSNHGFNDNVSSLREELTDQLQEVIVDATEGSSATDDMISGLIAEIDSMVPNLIRLMETLGVHKQTRIRDAEDITEEEEDIYHRVNHMKQSLEDFQRNNSIGITPSVPTPESDT